MKERNALYKELTQLGLKGGIDFANQENAFTVTQPVPNPVFKKLPCDPPVASDDLLDSPDWCDFRTNAVKALTVEHKRWISSGKRFIENQAVVLPFLKDYWTTVATYAPNNEKAAIVTKYPLNSANETNPGANWGAAFLSFIIDKSRRGTPVLFDQRFVYPFSGLNMANIVQSLKNRIFTEKYGIKKTVSGTTVKVRTIAPNFRFPHFYGTHSIRESKISIQPGDILCFNVLLKDDNYTSHNLTDIKRVYIDNGNTPSGDCNCEMIVSTSFDMNTCKLTVYTIGGNLIDSVRRRRYRFKVDKMQHVSTGAISYRITPPSLLFGIIKFPSCTSYKPDVIPLRPPLPLPPLPLKDPFKPPPTIV